MKEKFHDQNDGRIFYRVTGEGPVVMLVHGFGEEGNIWKQQYDAFPGYRLIIPDLPGSGRSAMTNDLSMESLAKVLHTILAAENVSKCTMIGHSMGGYITLAFAQLYPDVLNGFGLCHSSAFADSEEKIQTRNKGIEFIEKNGADAFLKTMIPNLYHPETVRNNSQLVEDHIVSAKDFQPAALTGYYKAMIARPDRTSILKDSYLPVLFILGRKDTAIPIEDGLKQVHIPKNAHVCILEKSGHMGMLEETEDTNNCIRSFLTYVNTNS